MKKLKLGFIGGGINSAVGNTHRIASQMDNRWIIVAGCFSTDTKKNSETAEMYGVCSDRTYLTWQDFLNKEKDKLDAICILTPTTSHFEILKKALNLGFAIICEKAMVNNHQEAIKINKIVKEKNSFLAVIYNYTGYPMVRELRTMIQNKKLGKINQIQIEMPQEGYGILNQEGNKPTPQKWRLKDGKIPMISLDLGVHLHHLIYFLTGEKPLEVVADQTSYGFFEEIIDNIMCLAKYTGNLKAQIWYSKSALGNRNGLKLRVFGNKGSAEWFQMVPEEIKFSEINGNNSILDRASQDIKISNKLRYNRFKVGHPAGFIEAFANYYYDIAETLIKFQEKGKIISPWIFTSDIAVEGLEMLEAISKSANNNSWEKIKSQNII